MIMDLLSIFIPMFKDFRVAKHVEISNNQAPFHVKGIVKEDKVTTNRFSQLRPRKSNDKNNSLEKFLLRLKKLSISGGTITF